MLQHPIIHTASREQTPVGIGAQVFINGKSGDMVVLHGPYIGPGSYVDSRAVVADEVLVSGIVLPNTVLNGVENPQEWHIPGPPIPYSNPIGNCRNPSDPMSDFIGIR